MPFRCDIHLFIHQFTMQTAANSPRSQSKMTFVSRIRREIFPNSTNQRIREIIMNLSDNVDVAAIS